MPNVFKNYVSASVGTSSTTIYTVPSSTVAVLVGLNLANRTAGTIKVDVLLGTTYVCKDVIVPTGSSLGVLDGKIIAEAAETIKVLSDTASSVDVILSCLEQS